MTSDSSTETTPEFDGGWRVSLAFWVCLLLAAAIYAAVALSPKLLNYVTLRDVYLQNQAELVSLERRVTHLGRVKQALENDPQFAAELARIDFDAARPGDERIAVEPLLSLESVPTNRQGDSVSTTPRIAWYAPLLGVLAGDRNVRASCLIIAAIITLGAFTFLGEVSEQQVEVPAESAPPGILRRFFNRYRRDES